MGGLESPAGAPPLRPLNGIEQRFKDSFRGGLDGDFLKR
jgi:hypothetical protein